MSASPTSPQLITLTTVPRRQFYCLQLSQGLYVIVSLKMLDENLPSESSYPHVHPC